MAKQDLINKIGEFYNRQATKQYFILSLSSPIYKHSDYSETWYTLNWEKADAVSFSGVTKVVQGNQITFYVDGTATQLTEEDVKKALKHLVQNSPRR